MLSKKYYSAIAQAVKESETKMELMDKLVELFRQDNPKFDSTKFREAYGEGVLRIPR